MEKESQSKRLKILNRLEIREYFGLPVFSLEEREYFFHLTDSENEHLKEMRGPNSKISFILRLGYFKARKRFYNFQKNANQNLKEDISYIARKYFSQKADVNINTNKNTITKQKEIILNLFSYKDSTNCYKEISEKAKSIATIDANPRYVFKELVRYTKNHRIVLPSYKEIQRIISRGILFEEARIFALLNKLIDNDLNDQLEKLLSKEEKNRYLLTIVRTPAKGFYHKQVSQEIKKKKSIEMIYQKTKIILSKLNISDHTIKYFARLADSYSISRLKRFEAVKQYFYVLCFIYYRYLKINDDLVKTFLYLMGKYTGDVKASVNENILLSKMENNKNLSKGSKLLELFTLDEWDNSPFKDINSKAYTILERDKIKKLADYLCRAKLDNKAIRWQEYDKKYNTIRKNIRHIIAQLSFRSDKLSANRLLEGVEYLKNHIRTKKRKLENIPTKLIPPAEARYLYTKIRGKSGKLK